MAIWSKTSQNVYTGAEIFIFFVISGGNFRQYRTKIVRQVRSQIFVRLYGKTAGILTYVKGFLCNITEKMQADDVQSFYAFFVRYCL